MRARGVAIKLDKPQQIMGPGDHELRKYCWGVCYELNTIEQPEDLEETEQITLALRAGEQSRTAYMYPGDWKDEELFHGAEVFCKIVDNDGLLIARRSGPWGTRYPLPIVDGHRCIKKLVGLLGLLKDRGLLKDFLADHSEECKELMKLIVVVSDEYPDPDIVRIIGGACLKHSDSGESSYDKEARVILAELEEHGYLVKDVRLQNIEESARLHDAAEAAFESNHLFKELVRTVGKLRQTMPSNEDFLQLEKLTTELIGAFKLVTNPRFSEARLMRVSREKFDKDFAESFGYPIKQEDLDAGLKDGTIKHIGTHRITGLELYMMNGTAWERKEEPWEGSDPKMRVWTLKKLESMPEEYAKFMEELAEQYDREKKVAEHGAAMIGAAFHVKIEESLYSPVGEERYVWRVKDVQPRAGEEESGDALRTKVTVYEIGYRNVPRTNPDTWCDRRVCEGFWNDEIGASAVTSILNRSAEHAAKWGDRILALSEAMHRKAVFGNPELKQDLASIGIKQDELTENITVAVCGQANSGKARLVYLIKNFLRREGFVVKLNSHDFQDNEHEFDAHMATCIKEIVERIRKRSVITIEDKQMPRK
jgi:hypothetical protein